MIAIKGGKIIPVAGDPIENGVVLIENGKIAAIGQDVAIPAGAQIIDATGKWVTPGFIDAHSHLSLMGEPAPKGAIGDVNEATDPITPQVRAMDSFNPLSWDLPLARQAGFTTCCTLPGSANVVGGTSFCFKLKPGKTVCDVMIPGTEQMKMAFGENPKGVYGGSKKFPMTRMGVAACLRETLFNAKVYSDKLKAAETNPDKAPTPNFKLEALVPVVRGEMRCRIHCHRADDIVTACRIAQEFGLDYIIEHGTEGYMITDYLRENHVTVIHGPMLNPPTKMEIWNRTLEAPGIFEQEGVNFCMTADHGSGTQWLPMHLGLCVARGLPEKAAFESVTLRAAKVLGLEDRIGSLEVGKDADIAIFNGHPFSSLTLCTTTIIDGVVYNRD